MIIGCHHQLKGPEFEQALGDGDEQGGLACCSPWDRTQLSNGTELVGIEEQAEDKTLAL